MTCALRAVHEFVCIYSENVSNRYLDEVDVFRFTKSRSDEIPTEKTADSVYVFFIPALCLWK